MENLETFTAWGIVELFGHNRVAGKISEHTIGGCSFVRVDIPKTQAGQAFTRMFGNGAIYSINITTEEVARLAAEAIYCPEPITAYEIECALRKRLPESEEEDIPC